MRQTYRRFVVLSLRRFSRLRQLLVRRDRGLQTLQRRFDILGEERARHRAAVPHQFEQSDCHIAEHRCVRVGRAGKGC